MANPGAQPGYPGYSYDQNSAYSTSEIPVVDPLSAFRGNLDTRVTEVLLSQIFSVAGMLSEVKLIKDKPGQATTYGFVTYFDPASAAYALSSLNGKKLLGSDMKVPFSADIKVNWAESAGKEDTSGHFHVFIGDLAQGVDDKTLYAAFRGFPSLSEARVSPAANSPR